MASSNRHWPSMFKSKPCNTHHQWQHDINPSLISSACHRTPYTSAEERSPEPKPRWNPKPEQIRILEAIFNSGMVNPPRDEIRKIRTQLQEYGQVGDANVFYWFQNRKSRSKHKLKHLQNSSKQESSNQIKQNSQITASSSSSSSEKSSPNGSKKTLSIASVNVMDVSNSPAASVNQTYFQTHGEFLPEPFMYPVGGSGNYTQGLCLSELSNVVQGNEHSNVGPCTSLLLGEIMNHGSSRGDDQDVKLKMQPQMCYNFTPSPSPNQNFNAASTINHIQGEVETGSMGQISGSRTTVFINDVAFEVATGPFNVKEAFGEDAMLINSSGQPVLTNEWGFTFHPLQHGAFYYLICLKQSAWGSTRENMEDNLI